MGSTAENNSKCVKSGKLEWWEYVRASSGSEATDILKNDTAPDEDSDWSNILLCCWKKTTPEHVYSVEKLSELLVSQGSVLRIYRNAKKRNAYIEMESVAQCFKASKALHSFIHDGGKRLMVYMTKKCAITIPNISSQKESGYVNLKVPGLYLELNAITPEEESKLIEQVDGHTWEFATYKLEPRQRRVQHYGFRFNYNTKRADEDEVEQLPSCCCDSNIVDKISSIVARVQSETDRCVSSDLQEWRPDQLTVNEYYPGQGIGPHVDTHSAFDGAIVSLSLASGIAMRITSSPDAPESFEEEIYLPRRSLLVLAGPSRYGYCHGISHRKTDLVNGVIIPRERRVSYTFRKVSHQRKCDCSYQELCDVQLDERSNHKRLRL